MRRHALTSILGGSFVAALLIVAAAASVVAMPARPIPFDENGQRVAAGPGIEKLATDLELTPGIDGRYPGKSAPRSGRARLPVLLVQFSGQAGQVPALTFSNLLFSTGTYATGSVNDYFREQGMVQITGQVVNWVTAPMPKTYYVNGMGSMLNTYPANSQGLVRDAVIAADPLVNFQNFDNDGPDGIPNSGDDDGVVDCVVVVTAGYAAESYSPANPQQEIWSHFSWLSAGAGPGPLAVDGVVVDPYTIQTELRGTSGAQVREIGVFCHEYGHAMGLADLWSTCPAALQGAFGMWNGLGHYDLMGYGGWGAGGANPDRPLHLSAFSLALLGWANVIPVSIDMLSQPVAAVENSRDVYWVSHVPWLWVGGIDASLSPPNWDLTPSMAEGWLVENRQPIGFDSGLPGSGLLVYHLDGSVARGDYDGDGWNNYKGDAIAWSETHPVVRLECADQVGPDHARDNDDLAAQINLGDAGDFFRLGNATTFDITSTPSTVHYGAGPWISPFSLLNVGPTGPVMTADFVVGLAGGPNHDVWVKDCPADDGTTPSLGNCVVAGHPQLHVSPDVWVDNDFDGVADAPVTGAWNYLHAKVRNRGTSAAPLTRVDFYDLSSNGTAPPPMVPPPPGNPGWASAWMCSAYALPFAPGDSATAWMAWWLPAGSGTYPPNIGVCVTTTTDTVGWGGDISLENNVAVCTGQELYAKAGTPAKAAGRAHAGTKSDPPALPIEQLVPINNPYDGPQLITVDIRQELPEGWTMTALDPDGLPVLWPWTVELPASGLVELTLLVDPGAEAFHGQTGSVWIGEYRAALYPDPTALIGDVDLKLGCDLRPPLIVGLEKCRLIDRPPCLPPAAEIQLVWNPVSFDVGGDPETPAYYAIYRDAVPLLPLTPDKLVAKVTHDGIEETETWEWTDPTWPVELEGELPWYAIVAVDRAGNESEPSEFVQPTAVEDGPPAALRLAIVSNRPNPFNPRTLLRYTVPRDGPVRLAVYDARGRLVTTLVNAVRPAGANEAAWDGRNTDGQAVPTGVYFARIKAGGETSAHKMTLAR